MGNIKKIICLFLIAIIAALVGNYGITASAQTDRRAANIKSRGNIDFDNGLAVIRSSDLAYLANEIDMLEDTYKTEIFSSLNTISVYYRTDGSTTREQGENIMESSGACALPFSALMDGIKTSQDIPDKTYSGKLPGSNTDITGNITAAAADNLSLGTAAWVEGKLIIGNGADNNKYYTEGYRLGYTEGVKHTGSNAKITYTYHRHTGNSDSGGGCYTVHMSGTRREGCGGGGNCSGHYEDTSYAGWHSTGTCNVCGANITRTGSEGWEPCPNGKDVPYSYYELGCGMTENTIIAASIVFN